MVSKRTCLPDTSYLVGLLSSPRGILMLTLNRFCIDINSPRTLQTATEKLFLAVSNYAKEVPIIVVATKKDEFLDVSCSLKSFLWNSVDS